jgi:hypothetical protein
LAIVEANPANKSNAVVAKWTFHLPSSQPREVSNTITDLKAIDRAETVDTPSAFDAYGPR